MSRKRSSSKRAFSIIESLVVMAVIILLGSIVIAGLLGRGQSEPKLPTPKSPKGERIERPEEVVEPDPVNSPTEDSLQPKPKDLVEK